MPKYTATKDKELKNSIRYSNPSIGSIYVPKDTVQELGWPDTIEVTIEAGTT